MKPFKRIWLALLLALSIAFSPVALWASDLSITAANVVSGTTPTPQFENGTAGATITAGQVVYKDATTNTYKLADNDGASAALASVAGIALHGASSGQPLKVQTAGGINVGATLTVGEIYVLSATPGGIAPKADLATGKRVTVLGVATTTSNLMLKSIVSGVAVP